MSRPPKLTPQQKAKLLKELERYIKETKIPVLAEFAYQNNVLRESLYDWPEFTYLRKRCIDKKEAQLEKLALTESVSIPMAIFSLKQLGWRDRADAGGGANRGSILDKLNEIADNQVKADTDDD